MKMSDVTIEGLRQGFVDHESRIRLNSDEPPTEHAKIIAIAWQGGLLDEQIRHPGLCRRVVERIKDGWTPEQIAWRMIYENACPRVCQETIYRYIYAKEGMREELWWYLPTHRKARRPRRACPRAKARSGRQPRRSTATRRTRK